MRESEQAVRLYQNKILDAVRKNIEAAKGAYSAAQIPFLSLVKAERNLINLLDRSNEAVADYHRRRAALDRAVGGPFVPSPSHP